MFDIVFFSSFLERTIGAMVSQPTAILCPHQCSNEYFRKSKLFLVPLPHSRLRERLSFDSPETSTRRSIHSSGLVNTPVLSMLPS